MTPKEREVMQMALTVLETLSEQKTVQRQYGYKVINSLRELLSQPEQEPVAWMHNFIDEVAITHRPVDLDRHPDRWTALYKDRTPCQTCEALARSVMMDQTYHDSVMAQREWQGLTDEEIDAVVKSCSTTDTYKYFRAIEQKLREKNSI